MARPGPIAVSELVVEVGRSQSALVWRPPYREGREAPAHFGYSEKNLGFSLNSHLESNIIVHISEWGAGGVAGWAGPLRRGLLWDVCDDFVASRSVDGSEVFRATVRGDQAPS